MSFDFQLTAHQTLLVSCGDEFFELPLGMLDAVLGRGLRAAPAPSSTGTPAPTPAAAPGADPLERPPIVRPPRVPRPAVIGVVVGDEQRQSDVDIQHIMSGIVPAPSISLRRLLDEYDQGRLAQIEDARRRTLTLAPTEALVLDATLGRDAVGQRFALERIRSIVENRDNGIGAIRLVVDDLDF